MKRRLVSKSIVLTTGAALLFAVWLCAVGTSPAHAQIAVSAPTDAQARLLGSWYQDHMPLRFRTHHVVNVTLLGDYAMAAYIGADADPSDNSTHTEGDDGSIDGVFEDDPPRITLRLPSSGTPDISTFAHEYGHYVWFQLLSKDDRRRYATIYDHQRATNHLVTGYAEDCLEEGFAEAFSFYLCQPSVLTHRDPLSAKFLSQWSAK